MYTDTNGCSPYEGDYSGDSHRFNVTAEKGNRPWLYGNPLLDRACGDTTGQRTLEDQVEDEGWNDADQRGRGGCGHVHQAVSGQRADRNRDGLRRVVDQEGHRNHVFVPSPDEEEYEHDAQCRLGNREHDLAEDGPTVCTINGRRF